MPALTAWRCGDALDPYGRRSNMRGMTRLLGDIGGTNARFALQRPGFAPGGVTYLRTADHPSLEAAIQAFLAPLAPRDRPQSAALAVAAPILGDAVGLVNGPWSFSIAGLRARFGFEALAVLNDFEALAHALPGLGPSDVVAVGDGVARTGAPRIVLGPGTGLGLGSLVFAPGGPVVTATEAGHVTLAATDDTEARILGVLRRRFGHVSAERVLSGSGLVNLYQAMAEIAGVDPLPLGPDVITARSQSGEDPLCRETVATFFRFLGTFASNAALIASAQGGVYIAGGIILRCLPEFLASDFRARFIAKGRYRAYLNAMPTVVVIRSDPAFLGLSRFLDGHKDVIGSGP